MFERRPLFQPAKPVRPKERSCKRIIKRDEKGRVKSEEFVGCSKEEVKLMKERETEPEDY